MRFYHFTSINHLPLIVASGFLNKGDVPTSQIGGINGTWFTSEPIAEGHGLTPLVAIEGSDTHGWDYKRRVRFTADLNKDDLVRWIDWGAKHCEPGFFKILNENGGGKKVARTWYISFEPIDITKTKIEVRGRNGGWEPYVLP